MILTTIAFLVLFAAIFVLFTEELQSITKKIYQKPAFKFLAPLFILSWLSLYFEPQFTYLLVELRLQLYSILYIWSAWTPFNFGAMLIEKAILLFLLTMLPFGLAMIAKKVWKHHKIDFLQIALQASIFIWVIVALLILIKI